MNDLVKVTTEQAAQVELNILNAKAKALAGSNIIPSALKGKPNDILVILMMAKELDIPPMQALAGINVIQGKPAISPQLMIAAIRSRFPLSYIEIKEKPGECSCTMARHKDHKDQAYTCIFTEERARLMGLTIKDNWKKQMGTMLKWRAVGDAARTVFPDVLSGMYFPDEFNTGNLQTNEHGELEVEEKQQTQIKQEKQPEVFFRMSEYDQLTEDITKLMLYLKENYTMEVVEQIKGEFNISGKKSVSLLQDVRKKELLHRLQLKIKELESEKEEIIY